MSRTGENMVLNVRGKRFSLTQVWVARNPEALPASLSCRDEHFDSGADEYIFNRNPHIFQYIMDYYVTGELHFPSYLCHASVKSEMEYWKLKPDLLSPCCKDRFMESEHRMKLQERIAKEMNPLWKDIEESLKKRNDAKGTQQGTATKLPLRLRLWILLEDPNSSLYAKIWSIIFFAVILLSVAILTLETLPYFRSASPETWNIYNNLTDGKVKFLILQTSVLQDVYIAEMIAVIFIGLDIMLRFLLTTHKIKFWRNGLNVLQFISVIPSIVDMVYFFIGDLSYSHMPEWLVVVLGSIRLLRVTLVFRSAKGFRSLKILALSIMASWRELLLMAILLFISVFIFSFMMFYTEFIYSDNIENIPNAIWLALITMTTVGYGDVAPLSIGGKVTGGLCAVCGILLIALPVAIIGNNFNQYYNAMASHVRIKTTNRWTSTKPQ